MALKHADCGGELYKDRRVSRWREADVYRCRKCKQVVSLGVSRMEPVWHRTRRAQQK